MTHLLHQPIRSFHRTKITAAEPYESTPGRWRVLFTYANGKQDTTQGPMQWATREEAEEYGRGLIGKPAST